MHSKVVLLGHLLAAAGTFPLYFVAVYLVGAIAAISLGLVAWYNSKRPVGWENSKRPDFIPEIKLGNPANQETGSPPSRDSE